MSYDDKLNQAYAEIVRDPERTATKRRYTAKDMAAAWNDGYGACQQDHVSPDPNGSAHNPFEETA